MNVLLTCHLVGKRREFPKSCDGIGSWYSSFLAFFFRRVFVGGKQVPASNMGNILMGKDYAVRKM